MFHNFATESKTSTGESNLPQTRTDKRLEALDKENSTLKQTFEETKRKLEGSRARCKVLETEVNIA